MPQVTLNDLARTLNQPAPVDGSRLVAGMAALADAGPGDVSILTSDAYLKQFYKTQALAVIAQRKVKLPNTRKVVFLVDDVEQAISDVLSLFAPPVQRPMPGTDKSATISDSAKIGSDCAIGPNVVIGQRATLGSRVAIHAGVVIGDDVTLGMIVKSTPTS